ERLYRRALAIDEQSYGPDHPTVAIRLNNLAQPLQATNRLAEAEPLLRRALAIDKKSYGLDHPDVARDLNLAVLRLNRRTSSIRTVSLDLRISGLLNAAAWIIAEK